MGEISINKDDAAFIFHQESSVPLHTLILVQYQLGIGIDSIENRISKWFDSSSYIVCVTSKDWNRFQKDSILIVN